MNKHTLSATFVAGAAAFLSVATPVFATYGCGGQYGSTDCPTPQDLSVNKQVYNPIKKVYVENLGVTDATFAPGDVVEYKLVVKNASGETFAKVTVTDTLPPYLNFEAGPGTYNASDKTLTFTEENMIAGESRTVTILTKVMAKSSLPASPSTFCVTNQVKVSSTGRNDSDTAQTCISTAVLGTTTLPIAGFEDLWLILPFAGVGLSGLALLKKRI